MINQSSLFSPVVGHQPERSSTEEKRNTVRRSLFSDENTTTPGSSIFTPVKVERAPLRAITPPPSKRVKEELQDNEEELQDNKLELFGKMYQIKQIGSGDYHKVYQFTSKGALKIDGKNVKLTDCVFRTVKCKSESTVEGVKPLSILAADFKGYKDLDDAKVPVPKVYLRNVGANGWGWVVEKLSAKVDAKNWDGNFGVPIKKFEELSDSDKKVLKFAKDWFKKMLQDKNEYIVDFKPDNVMQDKKGNFKVVDFGEGQNDEDDYDFPLNIRTSFKKWVKENQNVKNYLIDGLTEEEKKIVDLTV